MEELEVASLLKLGVLSLGLVQDGYVCIRLLLERGEFLRCGLFHGFAAIVSVDM
jgi:hypothetical protein